MKYILISGDGVYLFVNCQTKYLRDASQSDLEILYNNADPRVGLDAKSAASEATKKAEKSKS
jgi:hypothetical protein